MSKISRVEKAKPVLSGTPLDDLANWIAKRSRLVRFILAGLVTVSLTTAVVLFVYSYLFGLTPDDQLYGAIVERPDIITILLVLLAVIGLFFYWVGWRLLIGFDMQETPLVPGRGAALWLMVGLFIFIVTACLSLVTVSTAIQ